MTHISKIVDYLNLTTEYLLDNEDSVVGEKSLSDTEIRLMRMFRKMSIDKQNCLMKTAEYFWE